MNSLKKIILTGALAAGFIVSAGTFTTADAQDWRWRQQRKVDRNLNGVDGRYEKRRRNDRNRNGINDRYEYRRNDRNRNGVADWRERNWTNRNGNRYNDRSRRYRRW